MEVRIENVLSDENLALARESLQGKRDSCGLDGIKISMFDDYWKVNGDKIKQEIYVGKYVPGVVKLHEIVNAKQKRRNISLMNTVDRFIYRALMQEMSRFWEPLFSEYAYAYRDYKGTQQAVGQAATYIEQGYKWSAEIDIENYFDNIDQGKLLLKVQEYIQDPRVFDLLIGYCRCTIMDDHIFYQKEKGILQGGSLSPLLSNIYLNGLDHYMEKQEYKFCRFGDNINIYCKLYMSF